MDYESLKEKIYNQKFIMLLVFIFIGLFIFCSFIKFLGQWPVLLIISFLLTYYVTYKNLNFY